MVQNRSNAIKQMQNKEHFFQEKWIYGDLNMYEAYPK